MLSPLARCRSVDSSFVLASISVLKIVPCFCVFGPIICSSSSHLATDILMQFLYAVWSSSVSSFKSLVESSSHFVYLSTFLFVQIAFSGYALQKIELKSRGLKLQQRIAHQYEQKFLGPFLISNVQSDFISTTVHM